MPTAYRRIKHLKADYLTQEQRVAIGKQLIEVYKKSEIKPELKRVAKTISVEPEGTFVVLAYPKKFTPLMDAVIQQFCEQNPKQEKRQRLRKPIQRPERSYRINK